MGRLIDVMELEQRVKAHLGEELNLNHVSLLDVVGLLCDELEETNQQFADFVLKYNKIEIEYGLLNDAYAQLKEDKSIYPHA